MKPSRSTRNVSDVAASIGLVLILAPTTRLDACLLRSIGKRPAIPPSLCG